MSHEFRTPLNAIKGYTEIIGLDLGERDESEIRSDLHKIHHAADRLSHSLTSVLALTELEGGRVRLYSSRFKLENLIHDVIAETETVANQYDNLVTVHWRDELEYVEADEVKLKYCLNSVLNNACRFTRHGRVNLDIAVHDGQEHPWLEFTVADTGVGIPHESLAVLFQAFSQVDDSHTRRFEGTGISLAVAQRYCRMMGGNIAVESEVGKGSTFRFRIPIDAGFSREPTEESMWDYSLTSDSTVL